jgi:hypothetical protein
MIQFNTSELIVMDAKPSPKVMKRVLDFVMENKCLCGCGKPMLKLGLSQNCYYAYRKARQTLPKNKRVSYDAKLIRLGKRLPNLAIIELRNRSVFDAVASEVE